MTVTHFVISLEMAGLRLPLAGITLFLDKCVLDIKTVFLVMFWHKKPRHIGRVFISF